MSAPGYYQSPALSYPQSAYSASANTGGRPRDTPTNQTPYTTYTHSSDPMDRFWVTGQGTGRPDRTVRELSKWDQQWSSASRQ